MYTATTATSKIFKLSKRIRGVAGGTSASKTISILLWLIDYAQSVKNQTISIVSETMPHLKRGAMRDFLDIMETHNYYNEDRWNRTESVYTFETGTIIEFFSSDQPQKVRGPRRDILFINEANNVSFEAFTQLEIRTKKVIWLDWNPVSEFWFYTDLKDKPGVDFLILTYKDNEALEQSIIDSIESRKINKAWWRVYGEGQLGEVEGRIYTGWQKIDSVPHEARLMRRGLDFGYTNDPTTVVDVYYYNGGYILDEQMYQKGMLNSQIADFIKQLPQTLVIADSAEPKSIEELKQYGILILPAQKGRDYKRTAINYVQDQKISVTKRSTYLWKEYSNYMWMTDKEGNPLSPNKPNDFNDHCMDALLYALYSLRINDLDNDVADLPDDTTLFQGGVY